MPYLVHRLLFACLALILCSGTIPKTTPGDAPALFTDFTVNQLRTDGFTEDITYPLAIRITSVAELMQHYEAYAGTFSLSEPNSEFQVVFEQYTPQFFTSHYLIFILVEAESGSISHQIQGIDLSTGTIYITRDVPDAGTTDMAQWHIIVEVAREFLVARVVAHME